MAEIKNETVFVIMSTCRQYIAKGTPRNRCLIRVDDLKDKKRILTYASKGKAQSAYTISGFYGPRDIELEAVECNLTLTTK